jgi:hypothetical protein
LPHALIDVLLVAKQSLRLSPLDKLIGDAKRARAQNLRETESD